MTDKEDWDLIHVNIHGLRLMKGYKPTDFEKRVGQIILKKYAATCSECKDVAEKMKLAPEKKEGFLDKIGDTVGGLF